MRWARVAVALALIGAPDDGVSAEEAVPAAPSRVELVKLISWAEPAPAGCETDLEGSAPPASFTLRYREGGGKEVFIETSTDALFAAGWRIVNRSERGYGFEKAGKFSAIDFDVVEELRCSCGEGDVTRRESSLVTVRIDWSEGAKPVVEASLKTGTTVAAVAPVTVNGQLALYELRFARPFGPGECASRFLVALGLSTPIE